MESSFLPQEDAESEDDEPDKGRDATQDHADRARLLRVTSCVLRRGDFGVPENGSTWEEGLCRRALRALKSEEGCASIQRNPEYLPTFERSLYRKGGLESREEWFSRVRTLRSEQGSRCRDDARLERLARLRVPFTPFSSATVPASDGMDAAQTTA